MLAEGDPRFVFEIWSLTDTLFRQEEGGRDGTGIALPLLPQERCGSQSYPAEHLRY